MNLSFDPQARPVADLVEAMGAAAVLLDAQGVAQALSRRCAR